MYRDIIKQLALEKIAGEKQQIADFRATDIQMNNLKMFTESVESIFGSAKFTDREPPDYKKDSKDIFPSPTQYANYQIAVISNSIPIFSDDLSAYAGKSYRFGFKNKFLFQDEPLTSIERARLKLESVNGPLQCNFTGGWFRDDDDLYKLLVVLPNPAQVFNRVVKVLISPDPDVYGVKTINDKFTRYKYDYPLQYGIQAYNQVFVEYALLYMDEFIISGAKLKSSATAGGDNSFGKRIDNNTTIHTFEDVYNASGGDRPSFVARRTRDAIDLFPAEDEATMNVPEVRANRAWKTAIQTLRIDRPAPVTPVEDDPFGDLQDTPEDSPTPTPVAPVGAGLNLAGMSVNKIYNVNEIDPRTKATVPFFTKLEQDQDYLAINAWTSTDNPGLRPSAEWNAGAQGQAATAQPGKGAKITITFFGPKAYSADGREESVGKKSMEALVSFDRMGNVENGYEICKAIGEYVKSVDGARIPTRQGGGGIGNTQDSSDDDNAVDAFFEDKIKKLEESIDNLIEENEKYKNSNFSPNKPTREHKSTLEYMAKLQLYKNELMSRTPANLQKLNKVLGTAAGAQKVNKTDINLLRIIFD